MRAVSAVVFTKLMATIGPSMPEAGRIGNRFSVELALASPSGAAPYGRIMPSGGPPGFDVRAMLLPDDTPLRPALLPRWGTSESVEPVLAWIDGDVAVVAHTAAGSQLESKASPRGRQTAARVAGACLWCWALSFFETTR